MRPSILANTLEKFVKSGEPVLIKGAPGVAKTDIVKQVSRRLDFTCQVFHPVISDPTDVKGLPVKYFDDENKTTKAAWIPFGDLEKLIDATKPTVAFLDDLGQAPPLVQASFMQLLLARHIGEHHVSDKVTFVAATNRKQDNAAVSGILEPVKSRFTSILEVDPHPDDWMKWAVENNMPAELIGFIKFQPDKLHEPSHAREIVNSPSPRTVANVGRLMNLGFPQEEEYEVFCGAAGEGFAADFRAWLQIYRSLPDPDKVLEDPDSQKLPKETEPMTQFALTTAIASRATPENMDKVTRALNRLTKEQMTFGMFMASNRDKRVVKTKAFIKWAEQNVDTLI